MKASHSSQARSGHLSMRAAHAPLPLAYRLVSEFPKPRRPMPSLFLQVIGVGFLFLIFVEIFA